MSETIDTATGDEAPAQISEERVQKIFGEIAQDYETFNHYSSFGQDRRWLEHLVEAARIDSRSEVLDVAGGTGEVSFAICRARRPKRILLTDFTPEMLEVAKKRIAAGENRSVPVETLVMDAQHMPLEDESFDVVTMAYGIRNMPDREAALSEIHRVLRPGGTVAILEFSHPKRPLEAAFYHLYLKMGIPAWGQHFTGKRDDFVYLADSIEAFPLPEEFAEMIRAAGFGEVTYETYSFGAVAIHVARK